MTRKISQLTTNATPALADYLEHELIAGGGRKSTVEQLRATMLNQPTLPATVSTIIAANPINAVTAGAGTTLTAAHMLNGFITRTGPSAAFTDTTPTATQINAALGAGAFVGAVFFLEIANGTIYTQTIAGGTGVTLSGTATIQAGFTRRFIGLVTATGTPAVTLTAMQSWADGAVFAPAAGETFSTGADLRYPVGDVRRYGVSPDSTVVSAITLTAGSTTVTGSASTFTAAMAGMTIRARGATGIIASVAGGGASCTLTGVWGGANWTGKAIVGTNWESQYAARLTAIYANATVAGITIFWPAGLYNTGLNFTNTSSNTRMHFDPGAVLADIMHLVTSDSSVMNNVRITGTVTTCDRFGTIFLQNSFVERVRVLDGVALYGLAPPRGAHLYSSTQNVEIREMVIDGCSASNGDGALSIDDATNSSNIKIGRCRIKDSDVAGCNIFGTNHSIGELIVEGWGAGILTQASGVFLTLATGQELAGLNIFRAPGLVIDTVRLSQIANSAISCTTAVSTTLTGTGFLAGVRVGQVVTGTNIATHSLASTVTTSGSASITGSGFSALSVGQPVSGTGIPVGSFISAIASNVAATLSNKATASGTITMTASCVVTAIASDTSLTLSIAATGAATNTMTFTRPNALYPLRVLQTNVGAGTGKATIKNLFVDNVSRRGLAVGDPNNIPADSVVLDLGSVQIAPKASTALDTGYALFTVYAPASGTTKLIGKPTFRFVDTYGNPCFYAKASTEIDVGLIDTRASSGNGSSVTGYAALFEGKGNVDSIEHYATGTSSGSATPVTVQATSDMRIGKVLADVAGLVTIAAVLLQTSSRIDVGMIRTNNYRGQPAVNLLTLTDSTIGPINATESSAFGWGVRFNGCTRTTIRGGQVTGFAVGYKSGATLTDCVVIDATATGNTAQTDLTPAGLTLVGQCAGLRQAANNVLYGPNAGDALTTGDGNILFGFRAGRLITTASYNIFHGYEVGRSSVTGNYNVGFGYSTLFALTSAADVVAIGQNAGLALTTFSNTVLIGKQAGQAIVGIAGLTRTDPNVAIGVQALKWSVEGANIAIGPNTVGGGGSSATAAGLVHGNVGIGADALALMTQGSHNTAVGDNAGKAVTVGGSNSFYGRSAGNAATSGGFNVMAGHAAGYYQTTGDSNTYVGNLAGSPPIGGNPARTGGNNTAVGESAGQLGASLSYTVTIGANATTAIASTGKFGNALTDTTVSGNLFNSTTVSDINNAAGVTITAAQLLGGYINRSGAVAVTDTTPTAAAIVAAIPGCEVGTSREIKILSANSGLLTIAAGTGVTLAGTTTILAANTRTFLVRVTNVTASSEAVTLLGVSTAAS